jgi:DNA polymerase-4
VEIGRRIKREIGEELKLVASVGVAPNKFLAKVASDLRKPDAFVEVPADGVQAFLDPLPVERLWGVGRVSAEALHRLGLRRIGQLRQWSRDALAARFGSSGEHLWQLAHGIDQRPVVADHEARSISHETTFERDIADPEVLRVVLLELIEQVAWRLRRHGLRGRTVQLKVRFADFRTITRCHTLGAATDVTEELWVAAAELLATRVPGGGAPVRLVGVGVSGFDDSGVRQRTLFDDEEHERQSRLDEVTDQIRARFGRAAIGRAAARRPDGERRR